MLVRGQLGDVHGIARPAQQAAVGNQRAGFVEKARAGPGRLHEAAHHLARQIGQQHFAFIGRVEHRPLAERGGKNLALGGQRLDLLPDQRRLEFAEIEKADCQKRQRQDVDRNDAPRQRRYLRPAKPPRPRPLAASLDPRRGAGVALRGPLRVRTRTGRLRFVWCGPLR